jgi:transcriptional regulator with XRE-family HTH domain
MTKEELVLRKTLADNVRSIRKKKSISQEALGDIAGLHRTFVGSIERAERNVSLSTLVALSIALSTSVARLLTKTGGTK